MDTYSRADITCLQFDSFRSAFPNDMQERIFIVPNPVPMPPNVMPPMDRREHIICCVARIRLDQKQQDVLVNSFSLISKKFPSWRIELYGKGYNDNEEQFGSSSRL